MDNTVSDERPIEQLAHRTCSRYVHDKEPGCREYVFQRHTLEDFARALLALKAEQPAAQGEPVAELPPLMRRAVYDAIRGAYDLGYNDARNAGAVSGDGAPGYDGRSVEVDHGCALENRLAYLMQHQVRRPSPAAQGELMTGDALADLIKGMSVSVDVSTGDHDAGNRYMGTVTEVMSDSNGKHGLSILVQDAAPNFDVSLSGVAPRSSPAAQGEPLGYNDIFRAIQAATKSPYKGAVEVSVRKFTEAIGPIYRHPSPAAQVPEDLPWKGLNLGAMADAFHELIEAAARRDGPFINPITKQAQLALREFKFCIPAMLSASLKPPEPPAQAVEQAVHWTEALAKDMIASGDVAAPKD